MSPKWWLADPTIETMARRGDRVEDILTYVLVHNQALDLSLATVRSRISREGWRAGTKPGRRPDVVYAVVAPDDVLDVLAQTAPAPAPDEAESDKAYRRAKAKEEQERLRIADRNREVAVLKRHEAARLEFLEDFDRLIARRPVVSVVPPRQPKAGTRRARSLILFLSDVHMGQLMEQSSGLGKYDMAVMNERINRLSEEVMAITQDLRAGGPVDRLVIVWGGDIVDGRDIHPGHDWQSVPLVEQIDGGGQVLIESLLKPLAEYFPVVHNRVIPGNHGRIGKKGQLHRTGDSADMILGRYLQRLTAGMPNMDWHQAESWYSIFRLHGHNYVAAHGDAFKAFAGIPFYGAARYLQRLSAMFHVVPDALMVGHHHNAAAFPQGWSNIVMNGSVVGTGEFGAFLGYSGPPIQKLLLVSDDYAVATQFDLILSTRQEMVTATFDDLDAA